MALDHRLVRVPASTALLLIAWVACGSAHAAVTGCAGPGEGDGGFEALERTLSQDRSCQHAVGILHDCAWGSSADTSFAPIVVKTCENGFFARLSPSAKRNYANRMQMCAYRESRQDGTMHMSEAALCQADVAAKMDADPAMADVPVRASFDCETARSPLEHAICGDATLGQADIILADAYKGALSATGDKAKLVERQRRWLASLRSACRLEVGDRPTKAAIACATEAFERRFTALDGYGSGNDDMPDGDDVVVATDASHRASFDCQEPERALEIAICADSGLGKADIALAAAYRDALDAVGSAGHDVLVASERKWLRFVGAACPLGAVGGIPSVFARGCVRTAFETRIAKLRTCPKAAGHGLEACLDDMHVLDKPTP